MHPEISERDLIQWMIKHFHPRRRRAKKTAETTTRAISIPSTTGYASLDNSRVDIRDTKQALKDLKEEQKNEIKAIKAAEKEDIQKLKDDMKLLKSGSFPQLLPGDEEKDAVDAVSNLESLLRAKQEALDKEIIAKEKLLEEQNAMLDEQVVMIEDSKDTRRRANKLFKDLVDARQHLFEHEKADLRKAVSDTQKYVSSLTIEDMAKLEDIKPKDYRKYYADKADMLNSLLERRTIDFDKLVTDKIDREKYKPDEDKISQLNAEIKQLVGEGRRNNEDWKEMEKRGMSEDDIRKVMAPAGTKFLGTFAADEMHLVNPQRMKRFCFIMNTDPRSKPGEHWCAFFIDVRPHGSHSVEYYDPLADPISKEWFNDLKTLVKQVHPEDTYLRYKDNAIADQNDTSSNCGEFCCHFLLSRLANESFGRASGWDESGEPMIEKWKKANKKIWMSTQKGEGLRDIYDYVRKGATRIYQRIKD
ncbi:MAG: Ulp1 family isopeptidase, partial [Desulfosporosinus sp.]|nr:Ulp1 family isopeptidase [Desulfosporosinus sp.]